MYMHTGVQAEVSEAILGSHITGWICFRYMQNGSTCTSLVRTEFSYNYLIFYLSELDKYSMDKKYKTNLLHLRVWFRKIITGT